MTTVDASPPMPAAARWAVQLRALAVPDEILDAAPEPPPGLSVERFARMTDEAMAAQPTPSERLAIEALPEGGVVLDVGCGAGRGSLRLAPPAGRLVGFDPNPGMLAAFAERAAARGVAHEEVQGRWPDDADGAPLADVVVSHSVVYGVTDLVPFVLALHAHARSRVILQSPDGHPLSWMRPYWRALHGLERPRGPLAEDLVAVLDELGLDPRLQRWTRAWTDDEDAVVERVRRRLCLPPERTGDVRAAVRASPPPRERHMATVWWSAGA